MNITKPVEIPVAKAYRLLKPHELVRVGDFVADGKQGFQPWEGPGGFQADSFVKPIYRQDKSRLFTAKKAK